MYAGISGALVATVLLAAITDVQELITDRPSSVDAGLSQNAAHISHNGTMPGPASYTPRGTMSPFTLSVPIVAGLAMQLCVRDVSLLGTLGSLVLVLLAALAGTLDGTVSPTLQYWAYSSTLLLSFISLPSAVASGVLPQSRVCSAPLATWQRPDAAVIRRNIELGENRESTNTLFANEDAPSVSNGPGAPGRMPLNVHTQGSTMAITGTAPLNDSDSEEEVEGEAAANAARFGSTWHVPREEGGTMILFHSGEVATATQPAPSLPSTSAGELPGRPLYPRWRVFVQPPSMRGGASAPSLPREHVPSSPMAWPCAAWWRWATRGGSSGTSQQQQGVEGAPLLDGGDEESASRAGAGNALHSPQPLPGQGVQGLALDEADVDLFDIEGMDSDDEGVHGQFLGAAQEEQGSRGGTGTPSQPQPSQRGRPSDKPKQ